MVVGEPSIHNIMGGMESTGGVRLHNHKRKLKQRFDIIKKLGQGTYGKVQLGINKETGQEVAIKTIKKCKIETEADLIRIRREIQIMSSVQHPNIIHIYEVFENREKMVLVMEYAAGGELYDYLSERKVLTEDEARRIFRQITIAVFYCHKHKICHRDLKLENILLDVTGNAKIADFGLSNVFDNRRLLNTFCGSPLYASPEIVKGTPYHGPEVDCWSLGVLLYTLVYGAMPFDGSNFKRLTRQISASDYFEPKIPSTASPLIKDMLTKCPIERADIEKICSHWWVNQGYEENCLNIAENLAAQTPVRLDLLLSLVPQSASADKLVVGDARGDELPSDLTPTEVLPPTRCHSVGSLMELDRNNTEKIREMIEEETPINSSGGGGGVETKRKLETTPSMEETVAAGSKKKERSRKVDKPDERERKVYVSNSRHHSAPIATTIKEEQMEVDPYEPGFSDLNSIIKEALALQFIKEEERSKTPVVADQIEVAEVVDKKPEEEPIGISSEKQVESEISPKKSPKKSPKTKKPVSPKKFQVSEVKTEADVVESTPKKETSPLEPVKKEKLEEAANKLDEKPNKPDENIPKNEEKTVVKKLRQKAMSMDSDDSPPAKPVERRRSKIFETAEKFNQLAAAAEIEKPKKIFIPGVNVDGAKRVFERKASLGSALPSPPVKQSASKIIIDVLKDKTEDKSENLVRIPKEDDEKRKQEGDKKRAVDIISGALGKPPVLKKSNGSPPVTPQSQDPKKLGLKIQLAPNDVRNATVSVSTPTETKYPDLETIQPKPIAIGSSVPTSPEAHDRTSSPTMSSKMEITLKSATLPRRKTSKAEITLAGYKPTNNHPFKTEIEAKINAFQPAKLRTQRSEVAFPVAASIDNKKLLSQNRSSSLGPENRPKERIIPIKVENDNNQDGGYSQKKPPMPQRSLSQKSESLSRQSTADSDTDSAVGSVNGPEPIRKSPREYIIPISVEGGGYVTPRSGSLEPEGKNTASVNTTGIGARFGRGSRRIGSLLSDASEDDLPFSSLHRDSDDILQRHMHRLRSSRPSRQALEHADSLSSGEEEDDDDDGFELLTAENLFSTLLSRVRSLTQRLNVDDTRGSGFPSSRLLGRLGNNSATQGFWGVHEPLSRRTSESPFRRPLSRDMDRFGRKDSAMSSAPGTPSSLGGRSERNPSRDSVFDVGSSSTLPRDDHCEDEESPSSKDPGQNGLIKLRSSLSRDPSRENLTPCLARRLSRQFIEQTRQSLPRSPSIPRERLYRSSTEEPTSLTEKPQYRSRSSDRTCLRDLRRTNSLLDSQLSSEKYPDPRSSRRSISLFDDNDDDLPPLPRQIMTLGRKYGRDPTMKSPTTNGIRNLLCTEKIQEESSTNDDQNSPKKYHDNFDISEFNKQSAPSSISNNSTTNIHDVTPSLSIKSFDTSPAESSSNIQTDSMNSLKADTKEFESRLIAAENLIKESKLRNFGVQKYETYKDNDGSSKCDNELLTKRRSCIPSLRLRSESLNRDSSWSIDDRRKTLACSHDSSGSSRNLSPERSLLSKLFRSSSSSRSSDPREKSPGKGRRRISRFLRPDFFDTPREESQYVKDKEAQKAAENERRKMRFMRRKCDNNHIVDDENKNISNEKPEKEFKNKVNEMTRDKVENSLDKDDSKKIEEVAVVKNSFFQNLEKKFDKLMGGEESSDLEKAEEKNEVMENNVKTVDVVPETIIDEKNSKDEAGLDDLVENEVPITLSTKSKVSSVLGLFKNDSKSAINGTKPANTLLSKFKKNTYKGSRSDTSVVTGESSSKIPTKSKTEMKNELKVGKKIVEKKQSPDKIRETKSPEIKKSPDKIMENKKSSVQDTKVKEKSPSTRSSIERKLSVEKQQNKILKKPSPEKVIKPKIDTKDSRKVTPEKSENKLSFVSRLSPKKNSPEKVLDNKKLETKGNKDDEDKKNILKKKYVKSLTSLARNGSSSRVEKEEDKEKKVKKIVKKEAVDSEEKDENDDGKKKKIIKVVKKVVKKSSSYSDGKLEKGKDSEKISKLSMKKVKKENSPEAPVDKKEKSPKITEEKKEKSPKIIEEKKEKSPVSEKLTKIPGTPVNILENGVKEDSIDSESTRIRANRSNLKLDLTKIHQHSFKNPKTELNSKDDQDLSKITHHGTIVGHKIVLDKSLKAEDLAELTHEKQKAPLDSKTNLPSENSLTSLKTSSDPPKKSLDLPESSNKSPELIDNLTKNQPANVDKTEQPRTKNQEQIPDNKDKKSNITVIMKPKISTETPEDILSPMEDNESFDSWSICSNDYNNRIGSDLQSPTSPGYSPSSRGDNPESIIDRIRRKSFYSRFNERKRKNSLNMPPTTPGTLSSSSSSLSSSTLPRKFSFNNSNNLSKEISEIKRRNKPLINSYSSNSLTSARNNNEKTFSMYSDELPMSYRRSPIERERYSSTDPYGASGDLYATATSCYDPLRRYRVSPLPDSSARGKYSSNSDFNYDSDIGNYKNTGLGGGRDGCNSGSDYHRNTLPRKYGNSVSASTIEPRKTADYYEELLSPSRLDYLTVKKNSPSPGDCRENGFHDGSIGGSGDKWKNSGGDSEEESDSRAEDLRSNSQTVSKSKELSAACPDSDDVTTIE